MLEERRSYIVFGTAHCADLAVRTQTLTHAHVQLLLYIKFMYFLEPMLRRGPYDARGTLPPPAASDDYNSNSCVGKHNAPIVITTQS